MRSDLSLNFGEYDKGAAKLSLVFLILAGIVIVIFGAAMFHLMSLPSYEEKRAQQSEQLELRSYEQAARAAGLSPQEYKDRELRKRALHRQKEADLRALHVAIDANDNAAVRELFTADLVAALRTQMSDLLGRAIHSDNEFAFDLFLEDGLLDCDNLTASGHRAFSAAAVAEHDIWLERLLAQPCDTAGSKYYREVSQLIIKSSFRHRLADLPDYDAKAADLEKYFFKDLQKMTRLTASKYIEQGFPVNATNSSGQSALSLSARRNPEVAQLLLERGADLRYAPKYRGDTALLVALRFGELALAKSMLAEDPSHIRALELESKAIGTLFSDAIKHQLAVAADLVLTDDIDFANFPYNGSDFLIKAVEERRTDLLLRLLESGANPNRVVRLRTPLSVARKKYGDGDIVGQQIISTLLDFNATDDILVLVREANGKPKEVACALGKEVTYVHSKGVLKELAEKREKPGARKWAGLPVRKDLCALTVADCVNQGHGADDCVRSASVCSDGTEPALCCNATVKSHYFNARCAGLSVRESVEWMEHSVQ